MIIGGMVSLIMAAGLAYFVGYFAWTPLFIEHSPFMDLTHPERHNGGLLWGGFGCVMGVAGVVLTVRSGSRIMGVGMIALGSVFFFLIAPAIDRPTQRADLAVLHTSRAIQSASLHVQCHAVEVDHDHVRVVHACGSNRRSGVLLLRISGLPAGLQLEAETRFWSWCILGDSKRTSRTATFFGKDGGKVRTDETSIFGPVIPVPANTCLVQPRHTRARAVHIFFVVQGPKGSWKYYQLIRTISVKLSSSWWRTDGSLRNI
jgi:hypothetical protein